MQPTEKRKWSARAWWLTFHVYDYALLLWNGALGPRAQSTAQLAWLAFTAVLNLSCYVALQRSSPGYVEGCAQRDLEAGVSENAANTEEGEDSTDKDYLMPPAVQPRQTVPAINQDTPLRYCDKCQLFQPLRAKHCKDCNKCVLQYDHHCDCAGTCIGQSNRRLFFFYLCVQAVEAMQMLGVAVDAFTVQPGVDEWFAVNAPYIIAWLSMFFVLMLVIPLMCYQIFLLSTNQTSWEHSRRHAITYLKDLPTENSPFDRGCLRNWYVFVTGGDSNKWVHATSPKPAVHDDTAIM